MVWRSARKLEKECARNIELWLLCAIIPNYHSISDFRKQNPSGLKKLVQTLVSFLKDAELIGCEIIAIDGTKAERTTVRKRTSIKRK
jgi:transposase